jgi:magnesium transporter
MCHVLINCAASRQGKKVADIPVADIGKYTSLPDCFVWVALIDPDAAELAPLQTEFGLHELAIEDARSGHQRPKLEEYGSTLFVVVQPVEMEGTELRAGQIAIFVGRNFVVTVRRGFKRSFSELRSRS